MSILQTIKQACYMFFDETDAPVEGDTPAVDAPAEGEAKKEPEEA